MLIVTKMKIYQAQNHNSKNGKCNVRYWHKADIPTAAAFFRSKSGHRRIRSARVEKKAEASLAKERAAASDLTAAPTVVTGVKGAVGHARSLNQFRPKIGVPVPGLEMSAQSVPIWCGAENAQATAP